MISDMTPSTRSLSNSLSSPPSLLPLRNLSASSSNETVDITKSRGLLKRISHSALTPRKRALARKASKVGADEGRSESVGSSPTLSYQRSTEEFRLPDESENIDEKTILFGFDKAEIFTFDDNSGAMGDSKSQGRLLGHGKFEVFQLHQQEVTYLQCGSVVHPILSRLKILKISRNQFILPLSNPERYWRIVIATGDETTLKCLEGAFSKVCHFRNLFIQSTHDDPIEPLITETPFTTPPPQKSNNTSVLKTSESLSSITTAVACFNLESDSSTFVDEQPQVFKDNTLHQTHSHASTLDLALDSFFNEPEMTMYYTPDPSFILPPDESRDTITNTSTNFHRSLIPPKRRTQSRSSRSTSLYQSESSWMDPTEEIKTSTPATQRYVKLNLNPTPKTKGKVLHQNIGPVSEEILRKKVTDPKRYRYSSMDVFQMVKDSDVEQETDASFRSFLKSFF